jgi:hypothetical protein
MPSLYGTGTNYTVTASNVISLYQASTASSVITATTYSTNLSGLYGGYYSALPTTAEQLIKLFDNNGNVQFFLDPATNSATIAASVFQFTTATSAQLGNWIFSGNTVTNAVYQSLTIDPNGYPWTFGNNGNLTLPGGGTLGDTYGDGVNNVQIQPGPGGYAGINNYNRQQYVVASDSEVQVGTGFGTANFNEWQFNTDGTTKFPNYTFPAQHGTAGEVLVDNGSGVLYWTTATGGAAANQVFDFGTIIAPVSFTLDMGPIIV